MFKKFSKTGNLKHFTSAFDWGQGHLERAKEAFSKGNLPRAIIHARIAKLAFSEAREEAKLASARYRLPKNCLFAQNISREAEGYAQTAGLMEKGIFNK